MTLATVDFQIEPTDGWVKVADDPTYLFVKPSQNVAWHLATTVSGAPTAAAVQATGAITFSGIPVADETVTIGSDTYTFKAAATLAFEVTIGADAATTATSMITVINTDGTAALVASSGGSGIVTLTADVAGTGANSIVLTESATNVAVSGSGTLTGGLEAVLGLFMQGGRDERRVAYEKVGATTGEFYIRVTGQTGTDGGAHFGVIRDQA